MNYRVKRIIPVAGMFLLTSIFIGLVVFGAGHETKGQLPSSLENLEQSKLVEIKDESGQVILSGSFIVSTEPDGDIEGVARLVAKGGDAFGDAELEVSKKQDGSVTKEFEVDVKKLKPATTFNVFVDGQQVSSLRTNARGSAELELSNRPTK